MFNSTNAAPRLSGLLAALLAVPIAVSVFFLLFGGTRVVRGVAVFWIVVVVIGVIGAVRRRRTRS
jgi:hypothetical protein